MSECVVRMERVPKNCDDGCWGSLSGECPWCDSIDGYKMVGNRPPKCPIIAVLPEGHGRLVDADLFKRQLCAAWAIDEISYAGFHDLMRRLNDEHTIVPAEAERR